MHARRGAQSNSPAAMAHPLSASGKKRVEKTKSDLYTAFSDPGSRGKAKFKATVIPISGHQILAVTPSLVITREMKPPFRLCTFGTDDAETFHRFDNICLSSPDTSNAAYEWCADPKDDPTDESGTEVLFATQGADTRRIEIFNLTKGLRLFAGYIAKTQIEPIPDPEPVLVADPGPESGMDPVSDPVSDPGAAAKEDAMETDQRDHPPEPKIKYKYKTVDELVTHERFIKDMPKKTR